MFNFPPSFSTRRPPLSRQGGAIAILVGLSIVVLVGFAGLALDIGRLYIFKTELQNSADACALAAAQALTGVSTDQLERGELAGIAIGMRNAVLMQGEPVEVTENESITFSDTFNGAYQTKAAIGTGNAGAMKFARCEVVREEIPNLFIRVLNLLPGASDLGNQTVRASAIATLRPSQTNCALPVAICQAPSLQPGTWVDAATDGFRWVSFGDNGNSARDMSDMLTGSSCDIRTDEPVVQQGPSIRASVAHAWNSRFGIYFGSVNPAESVPDFTGWAYTERHYDPTRGNVYPDFQERRAGYLGYQGNESGRNVQGNPSSMQYHQTHGADRRLGIAPIVDCGSNTSAGHTAPRTGWACVLMLHPIPPTGSRRDPIWLEYRGLASEPTSPCVTLGVPGPPPPEGIGPQVPTLVR